MNATVRVWDPYVRVFHWALAASFAVAWLTADEMKDLHEFAGYAAGALVVSRLVMGFAGSRYTRFSQFVRSPAAVLSYARDMIRNRDRRYLGHNPLGAIMVLILLAGMASIALTGWMQTTDAYWGVEWVEDAHETLANLLLICVVLHLAGVLVEGLRHHENLVKAMLTGRKRAPGPGDIA